jgi:hypothetical protein
VVSLPCRCTCTVSPSTTRVTSTAVPTGPAVGAGPLPSVGAGVLRVAGAGVLVALVVLGAAGAEAWGWVWSPHPARANRAATVPAAAARVLFNVSSVLLHTRC